MERYEWPRERAEVRRDDKRVRALEAAIDERDETIRLLNEALSEALADLDRVSRGNVTSRPDTAA